VTKFIDEADVFRMLGATRESKVSIIAQLDREGFPKRDPIVGKWWLPAITAFFDRRAGIAPVDQPATIRADGEENWTS